VARTAGERDEDEDVSGDIVGGAVAAVGLWKFEMTLADDDEEEEDGDVAAAAAAAAAGLSLGAIVYTHAHFFFGFASFLLRRFHWPSVISVPL